MATNDSERRGAAPLDDIELMAYLDGELEGAEAEALAQALAGDVGARQKAEALRELNDVTRSYLELAADEAEPALDAMWSRIEAALDEPAPSSATRAEPARPGLLARLAGWLEEQRGYFATGALAAAGAAALVLMLRPPQVVERVVVERQPEAPEAPAMVRVSTPPEVEILEVNDGSASIFTLTGEGDDDVTAGVIWLDLDDTEMEDPL